MQRVTALCSAPARRSARQTNVRGDHGLQIVVDIGDDPVSARRREVTLHRELRAAIDRWIIENAHDDIRRVEPVRAYVGLAAAMAMKDSLKAKMGAAGKPPVE